jgi:acetyl esterase/lipase
MSRPRRKQRPIVLTLVLLLAALLCVCLWAAANYVIQYQALAAENDIEFTLTPDHQDVLYCTMEGVPLYLDLYAANQQADTPSPVVVYVHGGSYVGGDKAKGSGLADIPELVERGYSVASVNYRLAPEHRFPAPIEDVKCAIRFLRAHATEYNLDPDRLGAMGGSAGGHLVSLLGLTDPQDGFDTGEYLDDSSKVSAVVDMFGPADLTAGDLTLLQKYLRYQAFGTWESGNALLAQASSVNYLIDDAPPFLILHGDHDDAVPLSQSQRLFEHLQAAGIESELIVVQNANHNFAPTAGAITPGREAITRLVADFFDQYLAR